MNQQFESISYETAISRYQVYSATNGEEALESFIEILDLIILDVMLTNGWICSLPKIGADLIVPIIFLTALEAISERVAGLDLGADDYLSKPFSPKELEARIATILRRMGPVFIAEIKGHHSRSYEIWKFSCRY